MPENNSVKYTIDDLLKIGPIKKWIEMYKHYQDLLTEADATRWLIEQRLLVDVEKFKVKIWYSLADLGDGETKIRWFLTEEEARKCDEKEYYGEQTFRSVETFINSDIHQLAIKNTKYRNETIS